jgi:hypothetical protein
MMKKNDVTVRKVRRPPLVKPLQSVLNIQPGEGARVSWMMLYSVAAIGARERARSLQPGAGRPRSA